MMATMTPEMSPEEISSKNIYCAAHDDNRMFYSLVSKHIENLYFFYYPEVAGVIKHFEKGVFNLNQEFVNVSK